MRYDSLKGRIPAILLVILPVLFISLSCATAQSLKCTRVIDGDTSVLSNREKVRLIGVDTPETVRPNTPVQCFGKEASAFTRQMVEGKAVRLEYEWQQRDKYCRLLAYVYLMEGTDAVTSKAKPLSLNNGGVFYLPCSY